MQNAEHVIVADWTDLCTEVQTEEICSPRLTGQTGAQVAAKEAELELAPSVIGRWHGVLGN